MCSDNTNAQQKQTGLKKKGGGVVIETDNPQLLEAKGKWQEGP